MPLNPKLLTIQYISQLAQQADRLTVRIHTGLVQKYQSWTKLWYFLRGVDRANSGFGRILITDICHWLGAAPSTVRQWLREGKSSGAFRFWAERRGIISVATGSPTAVCLALKLYEKPTARSIRRAWGEVSEISIFELDQVRAHATAVTLQHLQNESHFAATVASAKDRKRLRVPTPEDLFEAEERASLNPDGGALLPYLCKISPSRFWVSKSFRIFGASQVTAAKVRGYCDRTIRHHLSRLGIESKQIVQSKADYGRVASAIDQGAEYGSWGEGDSEITLVGNIAGWDRERDQPLIEHRLCEGVAGEFPRGGIKAPRSRFFQAMGKWWMYRCNVYNLTYPLHSMERARDKWWGTYVFDILGRTTTPNPPATKLKTGAPPQESRTADWGSSLNELDRNIFLNNLDTTPHYLEELRECSFFETGPDYLPG